ncbi:serine/threonine protein kinase-like protein [Aulographum hederae CBS 113979]|uniref:non-specific serine/threonine protein kinase n=1 Tax=Aulographum hederae CBS 113979 TaxID=1176131 RepID=A0A6G1GUY4_9PEZI|nr:serine/threonine protein kinase-like protein [Aulographum hederae CBS 113979]
MASRPTRTPVGGSSSTSRKPADEKEPIRVGNFQRLNEIGKGSFALVYRGVHVTKGTLVAIKSVQLYKLNKKLRENLQSEIDILKSLHHPHIVALIERRESVSHMHLVMEFCEMGDLSHFIKSRHTLHEHESTADLVRKYPNTAAGGLNEVVVRHFLKQIASALEFLRAKNYVHRDIKPQNLLLVPSPHWYAEHRPAMMPLKVDENSLVPAAGIESLPMLKVADFGFARVLPQTSLAETLCGSPLYMAPEILRYEKYDAKADLWSVGTVVHELIVGKPPFRANNHVELLRKIELQNDVIAFARGVIISRDMKDIIRALLKKSPIERISFEAFFDSPVIRDEIPGLVDEDRISNSAFGMGSSSRRAEKAPARASTERVTRERSDSQSQRYSAPNDQGISPKQSPRPAPATLASRTPPKTSADERYSQSPKSTREPQAVPQRERRPAFPSHATAPARPQLTQDRSPVAVAAAIERRNSRHTPSPSASYLKEHLERERVPQRIDERSAREAREQAAQEVAFERDYVLVEKRAVEVNALADEIAHSPQLHSGFRQPGQGQMIRRATTAGINPPTSGYSTSRAIQIVPGKSRADAIHQRTGSYERRYGPSPSSATSAISKALNMANFRLWGLGISPPSGRGLSPPQGYGAFPSYPTSQGNMLMIGDSGKQVESKDEDAKVVLLAEEMAHRSDVVYGFAEVKYKQLVPVTPAQEPGLGIGNTGKADEVENDDDLTVDAVVAISEEALVLYVKALAILAKAIDLAASWWGQKNRGDVNDPARANSRSSGARMNQVVQWVRARFNDCVEKSEFVGRRLVDAQRQLPYDHPGHPSNHPADSGSATSIGTSAENITLTSGVTAEKLMYDRAVEMSRAAAVNELVNVDLEGCEISYRTAVFMLEAVLDDDDAMGRRASHHSRHKAEGELINGLENEDRATVQSIIDNTKARLKVLRRKIENQKAARRASLPPLPAGKMSPSTTPQLANTPPK